MSEEGTGSILANEARANGSISASGGGYAGCSSVAVVGIATTSASHWGTYWSITKINKLAYVASIEEIDLPTDETTSTGASLLALGVAPAVALRRAAGTSVRAEFTLIEKFAGKTRLGVRSAHTLRTAIRFRLATRIHTRICPVSAHNGLRTQLVLVTGTWAPHTGVVGRCWRIARIARQWIITVHTLRHYAQYGATVVSQGIVLALRWAVPG